MNKYLIGIIVLIIVLSFSLAICQLIYNIRSQHDHFYLTKKSLTSVFAIFWSYYLLMNSILPLSLMTTMEGVKLLQAFFIAND